MDGYKLMKRLIPLLLTLPVWAAQYYADNSCQYNGNGTASSCAGGTGQAGAFNSGSNAMLKTGGYAADDVIALKCGQTYRETLTWPNYNGTSGHPITLTRWGSCTGANDPIISGAQPLDGFTEYTGGNCNGSTTHCWSVAYTPAVALTATAGFAWKGDTRLTWETSSNQNSTSLLDQEYYFASNTFYLRNDAGNPASAAIEATSRNSAISITSHSYVTFSRLQMKRTAISALNVLTASTGQTYDHLTIDQVGNLGAFGSPVGDTVQYSNLGRTYTAGFQITGTGTPSITFAYNLVNGTLGPVIGSTNSGNGNIYIYNNGFTNTRGGILLVNPAATVTYQNNWNDGSSYGPATKPFQMTAGTLNATYSNILPDGQNTSYFNSGMVNEDSTDTYYYPGFMSANHTGLFGLSIDDEGNLPGWERLNQILNPNGFYTTQSIDLTNALPAYTISRLQAQINAGNEIVSHTRSSDDLSVLTGITVGHAAGTTATVTVSGNHLTTAINGTGDLNYDLTNASYDTLGELCTAIAGVSGYTCTITIYATLVPSQFLAAVSGQSILSPYAVQLDTSVWYPYELAGSKSDLQSQFTAPGGGALNVRHVNWPIATGVTSGMISAAVAADYESARAVSNVSEGSNWVMGAGVNLYKLNTVTGVLDIVGPSYNLTFNGAGTQVGQACKDRMTAGNDFTCHGTVAYNASDVALETDPDSMVFDGTSTYGSATASAANGWSDLHRGDFVIRHWIKPADLNSTHTLWFHSTDDNNYMWLYVATNGSAVLSIKASGSEVLHLATEAGVVVTTDWREVVVVAYNNSYKILVNQKFNSSCPGSGTSGTACGKVAPVTSVFLASTVKPARYTGTVYIGASYLSGAAGNYFKGLMDDSSLAREGYLRTSAWLANLAGNGGVAMSYHHGENGVPSVFFYPLAAALADFHGSVKVTTQSGMVDWIKSNGTTSDGQTYTVAEPAKADFRPRMEAPVCGRGTLGGGHTMDMDDRPFLRNDIGPYRCQPTAIFGGVM